MRRILFWVCVLSALACYSPERPRFGKGKTAQHTNASASLYSIAFLAGSIDDPKGKEGLTSLTAQLIAKSWPGDKSAQPNVQTDKELTVFTGSFSPSQEFYQSLAKWWSQRLSSESFEAARSEVMLSQEEERQDDRRIAQLTLESMLYQGHPYAHPTQGTKQSLASLTLDDAKNQATQLFSQERLLLGVVSESPKEHTKEILAALKESLPKKGAPRLKLSPPKKQGRPQVLLIEKDTETATLMLGFHSPFTRASPEFMPLELARSYLGEHRFEGGFFVQQLGGRGLTETACFYTEAFIEEDELPLPRPNIARRQQYASVWVDGLPTDAIFFSLQAIVSTIDILFVDGIPEEELAQARKFLGFYPKLVTKEPKRKLAYAIDDRFYGEKKSYYERFEKKLPKIDVESVTRALRLLLTERKGMQVIIIAKDTEALKRYFFEGKGPAPYPALPDPELALEDELIKNYTLPFLLSDIRIVPFEEIANQ